VGVAGRLGQGLWINEADLVHGVPLLPGRDSRITYVKSLKSKGEPVRDAEIVHVCTIKSGSALSPSDCGYRSRAASKRKSLFSNPEASFLTKFRIGTGRASRVHECRLHC
jgi:hypothetical protein